jgi:hypothetical protein
LRRRPRPRSFQRGMVSLCRTFQSLRSFSVFIALDDHPSAQSRTPERSHVVPVIPLPTHTQGSSRSARVSEDAGRPEVIRGDGRGIGPYTRTTSSSSGGGGGGAHVINMSFNISQTKVRFRPTNALLGASGRLRLARIVRRVSPSPISRAYSL